MFVCFYDSQIQWDSQRQSRSCDQVTSPAHGETDECGQVSYLPAHRCTWYSYVFKQLVMSCNQITFIYLMKLPDQVSPVCQQLKVV